MREPIDTSKLGPIRVDRTIGQHIASLNLFQEGNGDFYITVAGGDVGPFVPALGENQMQALASMIAEAGPRFVESWKNWRPQR